MAEGRLIKVRSYRSDPTAILYVVAEAERTGAINILEKAFPEAKGEFEDLGRVNDSLIAALRLKPGQFSRL